MADTKQNRILRGGERSPRWAAGGENGGLGSPLQKSPERGQQRLCPTGRAGGRTAWPSSQKSVTGSEINANWVFIQGAPKSGLPLPGFPVSFKNRPVNPTFANQLQLVCSGEGGLPEVTMMQFGLRFSMNTASWKCQFKARDTAQWKCARLEYSKPWLPSLVPTKGDKTTDT